jgi:xylose dehydrogenase (NAD/NADP)
VETTDRPLRWGVLGTALITEKLLAGARLSEELDVVAVASRDHARARAHADRHGIPTAHGSYDDLLADPGVDAVYVPLPNALHHPWTLRALEAGKHVLCEKPYSPDPREVAAAFDLAEERGLVLSEAYMYRYHPQTRLVHQLVSDGAVGDLALLSGSFTWPCTWPDVRLQPELDGGCLLDVGCYPLSMSRLLAGEPVAVAGQQVVGDTGVDVRFTATLRFADDVLAHLDAGFGVPDRSTFEVMGTGGRLVLRDPWHCRTPGVTLERDGHDPEELPVAQESSYRLELEAVGRAVRGDAVGVLGRDDALGQATALAALLRSARTEQVVTLG